MPGTRLDAGPEPSWFTRAFVTRGRLGGSNERMSHLAKGACSSPLDKHPAARRWVSRVAFVLLSACTGTGMDGGGGLAGPYSISGSLTPSVSAAGARVTLSGPASATTSADVNANYVFAGLANGEYTVTPQKPGFTSNPAKAVLTVRGASQGGVDFALTPSSGAAVSLWPTSAWLLAGGTEQFSANVDGADSNDVAWSASGGSISATGLYVAPAAPGAYTVSATSKADASASLSVVVNVTAPVADGVLLGDQAVEGQIDTAPAGQAAAFQSTALSNGSLGSLVIYLDASSTASQLVAGLYADAGGHPGALLGQAVNSHPLTGAWNSILLPATALVAGTPYWIAILATGNGTLAYRDARGACASEASASATLTSLPRSWITGTSLAVCPASIFGDSSRVVFFDDFPGNSLSPSWTIINRHGEYSQNETECNIPQEVSVADGLTITTAAQNAVCGDFLPNGSMWHPPAEWPYITGDIQWARFNLTYGTIELRARFPDQRTRLWPAAWLLDSKCQATNPETGQSGVGSCPSLGAAGYSEIDMTECYGSGWCQFHVANPGFGLGNGCDAVYAVDTNWHTFKTVWTSSGIAQYMDGTAVTNCNQKLGDPMFLLIQTQTGGNGGTPNNAYLPASLSVEYVRVTQP